MKYAGNSVSGGIAIGEAYLYTPFIPRVQEETITEQQTAEAVVQYQAAKERAKAELDKIKSKLEQENDEKAKIFSAHLDILYDTVMDEDIEFYITKKRYSADFAISSIFDKYAKMLDKVADELIRERAADIRDVKTRLLRNLYGIEEKNLSILQKPVVVVAHDLTPSDTATLDRKNVLAIISETGGETSHTAIIAKSYGIPAVLGVKDMMSILSQDEKIIVDAVHGEIYTEPTDDQIEFFLKETTKYAETARQNKRVHFGGTCYEGRPARRCLSEHRLGKSSGTGRFLFMPMASGCFVRNFCIWEKNSPPPKRSSFPFIRKVLAQFGEKPVILRTLDIGGDKTVSYLDLPKEDNPFLGNRALRLCFSRPDIF